MTAKLSAIEIRVLGCLIEKELATPDYYPLSLNALTAACNQKSNREPVMQLSEQEVTQGLDSLRQKGLARQSGEAGRVPKYGHNLDAKLFLDRPDLAVLAELLLRGPQTVGELRARASRMHPFSQVGEIEAVLEELAERDDPVVARLPRQSGRKEPRFAHRLNDSADLHEMEAGSVLRPPDTASGEKCLLDGLRDDVDRLREELAELRREFSDFKSQFE